ncbi:hypothetical protein MPH_02346 [Macrophomina phaseolina MS6]|uniref:RRM domain-containing protein n=1 Tax=Macrophomina phaseolina (strain MS6) TaxID=1126212 RepID=K2S5N5_MACPH|nr:hypothetical protein MPH_02346 [Macrophomina phaseolina MS6]
MTEVSSTRLYLGNLPRNATKADVEAHFATHGTGEITEIKLMNGFGFIEYKDAMDARDVVPGLEGLRPPVWIGRCLLRGWSRARRPWVSAPQHHLTPTSMVLIRADSLNMRLPTTSAMPSRSSTTANSRDRRSDASQMSDHPSRPMTLTTVHILTTTRSRRSVPASATGPARPFVEDVAMVLLMMTTTVAALRAATALVVMTTAVVLLLATTTIRVTATLVHPLAFAAPRSMTLTHRRALATRMTLTRPAVLRLLAAAMSPTLI